MRAVISASQRDELGAVPLAAGFPVLSCQFEGGLRESDPPELKKTRTHPLGREELCQLIGEFNRGARRRAAESRVVGEDVELVANCPLHGSHYSLG